ncbi:MAG: hypothetical protein KAR81_02990 [Sulfurimonas sp.]|nr:hypothetical protein [Sulfurimonas sp.]MCK4974193.1 hypothetical protein [Sulfurimonas sp.]
MAITYDNKRVIFASVIYEDDVLSLRDFLQTNAGDEINFDFRDCEDIHLAVLQLIMAYKKNYSCVYEFGDENKLYVKVLKGFDSSENHCN